MPARLPPCVSFALTIALLLVILPPFVHCFGAGNIQSIAKVEGINWRHGDIEDTLLNLFMARIAKGKKFSKMDVKRVYFGNWLRDYSQAVDVGTVKHVSAEAIRIILWVLGFMTFGYGTKEFEVTNDRLGVYRPEEHIDNPKDYADNLDAREYDQRLRGPVDEKRELSIDLRTGMKMYIASEDQGITTSAGLVRDVFGRSIRLARQYAKTKDKADLYEALRLLGTGCHCLEDFSAHSNYCEISLRQMGNSNVFPHVGTQTQVRVDGVAHPIFPIVTGTFGGVDFLHSVMGEFSDKITQSEITELEGTITSSEDNQNTTYMKKLLKQLPLGILGGDMSARTDELEAQATAAKMENMDISSKDPEALTAQLGEASKKIYPILEFHDNIMKTIEKAVSRIPVLPALLEQLQAQINIFVFSLLAPVILPIIKQVKSQLEHGSSAVIASSREKQHIVFTDDHCTDPTHSMLSKDHFSNVLNEPAGKVASAVLTWAVPQLMVCWDDEKINVDRTITRIINGVFHHPALRDSGEDGARDCRHLMFQTMENWWQAKTEDERVTLRDQLSRDGVKDGRNHKDGVHDTGHGCGTAPLSQSGAAIGKPPGLASSASSSGISTPIPNPAPPVNAGSLPQEHQNAAGGSIAAAAAGVAAGGLTAGAIGGATGASSGLEQQHHSSGHPPIPSPNQSGFPVSNVSQAPSYGPPPNQSAGHSSHEEHYNPPPGPPPGYPGTQHGSPQGGPPPMPMQPPPPPNQGQFTYGQAPYGHPPQPPYESHQQPSPVPYGQQPAPPQYGAGPYGQKPSYGQPPYGQAPYGQEPPYGQPPYGQAPYGQPQSHGPAQYGSPPLHEQPPYGQGNAPTPYGRPPYGGPSPYPQPGPGFQPYPPPPQGPSNPPGRFGQPEPPIPVYGANYPPQPQSFNPSSNFYQGEGHRSRLDQQEVRPQGAGPQFSHSPQQSHSPRRHHGHGDDGNYGSDEEKRQRRHAEKEQRKHHGHGHGEDEYSAPSGAGGQFDDYGSVGGRHHNPPPTIQSGYPEYADEAETARPPHHSHHHHHHDRKPDEGDFYRAEEQPDEYGRRRASHQRPYEAGQQYEAHNRRRNDIEDDDIVEDEYGSGRVGEYGYVHRRY